jgi:hypothetical protein
LLVSAPPSSITAVTGLDGSRKRTLRKGSNIFRFVKPSKKDPNILPLDGHCSHSRNIEVIYSARENGVHNVCLPPHSIHELQLMEVSFMQPLKTSHAQVFRNLTVKTSRLFTHSQITGLVGKAYLKSSTAADAANGFRKTCFFPCNRHIFDEHDPGRISQHHELFA